MAMPRRVLPSKAQIGDLIASGAAGRLVKLLSPRLSRGGIVLDIGSDAVPDKTVAALYLGLIERSERQVLGEVLCSDYPVIELGAGVGSVTLAIAEHIRPECGMLLVEANPRLAPWWQHNVALSTRKDLQFLNVAAASGSQQRVRFILEPALLGSRVAGQGDARAVDVEALSIPEIHRRSGFERFSLVCDIEGAEFSLLQESGTGAFLAACQSIVMEMHPEKGRETQRLVELFAEAGLVHVVTRHAVYGFVRRAPLP